MAIPDLTQNKGLFGGDLFTSNFNLFKAIATINQTQNNFNQARENLIAGANLTQTIVGNTGALQPFNSGGTATPTQPQTGAGILPVS